MHESMHACFFDLFLDCYTLQREAKREEEEDESLDPFLSFLMEQQTLMSAAKRAAEFSGFGEE